MTERRKLFSQQSSAPRRKLFSAPQSPRRKLFSANEEVSKNDEGKTVASEKVLVCQDCGYSIKATDRTACPHCGGQRFNVLTQMSETAQAKVGEVCECQDKTFSGTRRSIFNGEFQKEFASINNNLEQILSECSGKSIGVQDLDRLFSNHNIPCTHEDIIERGYAELSEDGKEICFSETAFTQEKLFSKLIITVTKELDLDPIEDKAAMISRIEESQSLSPKGVFLLRKAHSLPMQSEFSEGYLQDSGIANDLRLEYGGTQKSLEEFKSILSEQYDDAPENILDLLIQAGVIKIYGDKVEILK